MENTKIEKARVIKLSELIHPETNPIISKTIYKKPTGNIRVVSIDAGEKLVEDVIPFDTFAVVIDGKAKIEIDGNPQIVLAGEAIIIPAHSPNKIIAEESVKIISTVIKSGYE